MAQQKMFSSFIVVAVSLSRRIFTQYACNIYDDGDNDKDIVFVVDDAE